jgi:2',3'-cyclic-nucleotide 2'-phosphodiesterase (5'-nucleotidase family)
VEARAKLLVDQFNAMKTDAVTLGDRDLAMGVSLLKDLHKRANYPWLVANLQSTETGEPIFETRVIKEVAGVKVGLLGVTLPTSITGITAGASAPWRITDPTIAAVREAKALRAEGAEVIVVLSHLSEKEQRTLAEQMSVATAILGGQGVRMLQHPETHKGVFIAEPSIKGKYLSVMTLHVWEGKPASTPFVDRYRKVGLQDRVAQLTGRISSYERLVERRAKEDAEKQDAAKVEAVDDARAKNLRRATNVDHLKKQLVKLQTERQQLQLELDDATEVDASANYMSYELFAVDIHHPDEPQVAKAVNGFLKKYPKSAVSRPTGGRPPVTPRPLRR